MTEPQKLTIHLSGDAVVAPALRITQQTVETVSFCLIAVDSGDMSKPAEFEARECRCAFREICLLTSGELSTRIGFCLMVSKSLPVGSERRWMKRSSTP